MQIDTIDVIIPVYRPGEELRRLLNMLSCQTLRPHRILIMHTRTENEDLSLYSELWQDCTGKNPPVRISFLTPQEFDHGATRDQAAHMSDAQLILFMTQDAVPANEYLLEELAKPFQDDMVGAVYACQKPRDDCRIIERYTRSFNYPEQDCSKTLEDLPRLGIKTYFCSDVCAAYRRDLYEEAGGFVHPVIFNEDMIMACGIIHRGLKVYYASKAQVIHSHNYSHLEQFRRNFDLAVSQADHPEVFADVPSESEGKKMVAGAVRYLFSIRKPWLVFPLVTGSAAKYAGYLLGKRYKKLSMPLIMKCTSNPYYWKNLVRSTRTGKIM